MKFLTIQKLNLNPKEIANTKDTLRIDSYTDRFNLIDLLKKTKITKEL